MLMLAAASMLQNYGDLLVVGIVLAMTAYGAHFGLFLAVLAGMHALVSLVVALAFAEPLAALLKGFEMPEAYTLPAAFGGLFVGAVVAIRMAVGGFVPADVVRFTPAIDKGGGGLFGAIAGLVWAGAALIACSIMPLPEAFRIDGSKLRFDAGTRLLRTFARCAEPKEDAQSRLLLGEPPSTKELPDSPQCSELFVDLNDNDAFDAGEPYLDADGSGSFTLQLPFDDVNSNGRRDVGIVEAYRLGAWRNARVFYAPVIDSVTSADVPAEVNDDDVVYQITATDADPNDTFTYGMRINAQTTSSGQRQAGAGDAQDTDILAINTTTGAVKVADAHAFRARKARSLKFVAVVTDQHGLTTEKTITLNRRPAKPAARKEPDEDKAAAEQP